MSRPAPQSVPWEPRRRGPKPALQISLPSPRLRHHPLVGASTVLMVAVAAQIGVWLVNARLLSAEQTPAVASASSAIIANSLLFDGLEQVIARMNATSWADDRVVFAVCLMIALLSTLAWYAATRLMLGPAWALWVSMLWSVHPLFAFLAQRPTPLTLALTLVPTGWALLAWWARSRRRRVALIAGLTMGLVCAVNVGGLVLFPAVAPVMLAAADRGRKRWQGFLLLWVGFAIPVLAGAALVHEGIIASPIEGLSQGLWTAFDTKDRSTIAQSARAHLSSASMEKPASALGFLAGQLIEFPRSTAVWAGRRGWQMLYATADGRFARPLFVVQLAWLLPAMWGAIVGLGYRRWRWRMLAAVLLLVLTWATAAVAEPLARNLAPVGGVGIMLAAVGVADLYERVFGRRLTDPGDAGAAPGR